MACARRVLRRRHLIERGAVHKVAEALGRMACHPVSRCMITIRGPGALEGDHDIREFGVSGIGGHARVQDQEVRSGAASGFGDSAVVSEVIAPAGDLIKERAA